MSEEEDSPIACALPGPLLDVLSTAIAENGGGYCTAFLLVANYMDADGEQCYLVTHMDGQHGTTTLGLARLAVIHQEESYRQQYRES